MTTLERYWDRFWFSDGRPEQLAMARIATAVISIWVLLSRDFGANSSLPQAFWSGIPLGSRLRFLLFPGHESLEHVLQAIAIMALLGVLVGVWPRACALAAGLLIYHLAPLESIIWNPTAYIRGLDTVIPLIALSASPCGDAWALMRPRTAAGREQWEYNWPVRVIELMVVCVYFFAGYSKMVDVGWAWTSTENLRAWMLVMNQGAIARPFTAPGLWFAAHPELCHAIGIGTIVFELTFPLVLFNRLARIILIPAALAFHVAIYLTMNITVVYPLYFIVFVNWGRAAFHQAAQAVSPALPNFASTSKDLTAGAK